ncbi:type II toxin-antitoxin system Phd/YefM family antitoxin [Saccharothrix luteola]|uniref:type II toxin-antitoxin system Phd/YefM family antitoxin n=1 Tax=Saccharothrix luteola TaxID=2893018 RepID=UPI001E3B6E3F|nr:PhdYeFM domain-containing protein [Saccharothrix luteola]MCC8248048.1 PhdYeFM domain-containing protein [Saccharothrix luteola]MCC8248429.1 PhdYeFM domain-containing protein [Saccharothrix luteola]
MKVIDQREFDQNPAQIMEAVEAGETYHVTRDGTEVAELRPPTYRQPLNTDEVIAVVKDLPPVDYAEMRAEADEFWGNEDRLGDDDPWERRRG